MTTALTAPHQLHCLDGYHHAAARLHDFGITIAHTPDLTHLAAWDPDTATLHLREGAPLAQHLRVLIDMWCRIAIGPEASTARIVTPRHHLRLVP